MSWLNVKKLTSLNPGIAKVISTLADYAVMWELYRKFEDGYIVDVTEDEGSNPKTYTDDLGHFVFRIDDGNATLIKINDFGLEEPYDIYVPTKIRIEEETHMVSGMEVKKDYFDAAPAGARSICSDTITTITFTQGSTFNLGVLRFFVFPMTMHVILSGNVTAPTTLFTRDAVTATIDFRYLMAVAAQATATNKVHLLGFNPDVTSRVYTNVIFNLRYGATPYEYSNYTYLTESTMTNVICVDEIPAQPWEEEYEDDCDFFVAKHGDAGAPNQLVNIYLHNTLDIILKSGYVGPYRFLMRWKLGKDEIKYY